MSLKALLPSIALALVFLAFAAVSAPVACAEDLTDEAEDSATEIVTEDATETSDEIEISDADFKAYVLGCLFFFVIVIVFYFGYKFFAMFF